MCLAAYDAMSIQPHGLGLTRSKSAIWHRFGVENLIQEASAPVYVIDNRNVVFVLSFFA